jgi:hypothetical protein
VNDNKYTSDPPESDVGGNEIEDMPDWWDPKYPPRRLMKNMLYRGKDGRWYDYAGSTHSRAERRRGKRK